MVTVLSRQGGRRYTQMACGVALVVSSTSHGTTASSVSKRRYAQVSYSQNGSQIGVRAWDGTSFGSPAGGGGGGGAAGFSRAQAVNNPMAEILTQSTARNLDVFLVQSSDHITGATGLTLTINMSKNGAAFASVSPAVTELGNGWYTLALTSGNTDTLGDLAFHITGSGADPCDLKCTVEQARSGVVALNNDKTGYTISTNLDKSGYSLTQAFPANFSILTIDGSGNTHVSAPIKKATALNNFAFVMTDNSTHQPVAGKAVSVTRSIDGGGFTSGTLSSVTSIGGGIYTVNFGASDLNGNVIVLQATASSCDTTFERLITFS